jgi:hypothetical protein
MKAMNTDESPTLYTPASPWLAGEEEFLELVYADEEFLRAEFDAIIAAAWPTPPERTGGQHASHLPWRPAGPRAECGEPAPTARPHHAGHGSWRRQRSPPRSIATIGPKAG